MIRSVIDERGIAELVVENPPVNADSLTDIGTYTYELNISGEARSARSDFLEGRRAGYTKTPKSLAVGSDDGQA